MYNFQNSINSTGITPRNSTTSTTSITNTTPTFNLFWLLKKFKGLLLGTFFVIVAIMSPVVVMLLVITLGPSLVIVLRLKQW